MYITGIWASSRRVAVVQAQVVALGLSASPYIKALSWSSSGFGTAYSNPASLPVDRSRQVRFSPANDVLAGIGSGTPPEVTAYPWSSVTGFGTRYSNPVGLPVSGEGISLEFSPAGTDIALGIEASPYILVYPWSSGSGFGTKYSNPATLPTNFGFKNAIAFRNTAIVISSYQGATTKIIGYPWTTGVGFGTKYADPASPAGGDTDRGTKFGSLGTSVIRARQGSLYQDSYAFNAVTGFGTRYSDPATAMTTNPNAMAVNTAGNVVAFGQSSNVAAYPWSPGYGTKFANPSPTPSSAVDAAAFNSLDDAIAVAGFRSGTQVHAYAWNNVTGFGTKFSDPSPSFLGNGVAVTFTN